MSYEVTFLYENQDSDVWNSSTYHKTSNEKTREAYCRDWSNLQNLCVVLNEEFGLTDLLKVEVTSNKPHGASFFFPWIRLGIASAWKIICKAAQIHIHIVCKHKKLRLLKSLDTRRQIFIAIRSAEGLPSTIKQES